MAERALSVSKMKQQLERAKSAIANMREGAERATQMGTNTLLTTAGGAVGGLLAIKMEKIPGTEINSCLALGTVASGMALVGAGGKMGDQLNAFGAGLLAVEAYEATKKALSA
jgi:hypothetical protein